MRLYYDANTGQYIRIIAAKSPAMREREKQEPEPRRFQGTRAQEVKKWEDALNRVNISPEQVSEVNALTKIVVSGVSGALAIQRSTLPLKQGVVRVGLGNPQDFVDLQANSADWNFLVTIIEGFNGAKFPVSAINQHILPILGKAWPVRGDSITVVVQQLDVTRGFTITATIEEDKIQPWDDTREALTGPVSFVHAPQWATHFTVAPDTGVAVNDTVLINSPDLVLQRTYPAGEGRVYPLGILGETLSYNKAVGPDVDATYTFLGRK